MFNLINAAGLIPIKRLYNQLINYSNLKILSSSYTNPTLPSNLILANIINQLKDISTYTIIDLAKDKLTSEELVKSLDKIIIIAPNNISGISAALSICNLTKLTDKKLLINKVHTFKNIKLFNNNEIVNYLNIQVLGILKIDSYIKNAIQTTCKFDLKKSSEIFNLLKKISNEL
jgi:hypothetical protein